MTDGYFESVAGESAVLVEMPHSGMLGVVSSAGVPRLVAERFRFDSAASTATLGFGVDAAVLELSGCRDIVTELGLSLLANRLSRVFVDVNRARTDVSGLAVVGAERERFQHGVIWSRSLPTGIDLSRPESELEMSVRDCSEPLLVAPYSTEEFERLMTETYDAYHGELRAHHERIANRHGKCVHLALHTLAPVGVTSVFGGYVCGESARRGAFDPASNTLPDVILIHNGFLAADPGLVSAVRGAFESEGLLVEDGHGAFVGSNGVTAMYGDPRGGHHVIGIEHVTHGIEPRRHLGDTWVDVEKARRFRPAYRKAIEAALDWTRS